MDWAQAITVIGVFLGGFLYMMNRMDNKFEHLGDRVGKVENRLTAMEVEIKNTNQRLTDFQGQINQRLSTIEGYLVPKKVFHFEDPHKGEPEEPNEN